MFCFYLFRICSPPQLGRLDVAEGLNLSSCDCVIAQLRVFGTKCPAYVQGQVFPSRKFGVCLSECVTYDHVPDIWKMHFNVLRAPGFKNSVTEVVCDHEYVERSTADDLFGQHRDMNETLQALVQFSKNLPAVVERARAQHITRM